MGEYFFTSPTRCALQIVGGDTCQDLVVMIELGFYIVEVLGVAGRDFVLGREEFLAEVAVQGALCKWVGF